MKMTSFGAFATCNNSITVNNIEDSVRSTENDYSDVNNNITAKTKEGSVRSTEKHYSYVPQTDVYNPKINARVKFHKNKNAKRKGKMKRIRQNGNKQNVPKDPPRPRKGEIVPTNDSVDYVHQSLIEHIYPTAIVDQAKSTLLSINTEANVSQIFEVFEVIGALAISLPMCQTPAQVASQILLSIRAMTKGSVTEAILRQMNTVEWCKKLFGFNMFEQQTGEPEKANWLHCIPTLRENWDAVRNAPLFGKVSSMITVAASIGLCSITNLKWSVQGVDLFRVGTIKKHHTAVDLVGAILDTIVCFIEGGYECFRTGSFKPLLFTNDDSKELDALYFPLIELHEHAMVFNLHEKPVTIRGEVRTISELEYSQLLDEALELADRAYKSAKGTWQQGYLEKRKEVLHKNRAAYQAKRIDGSMRFAPFTVFIWGESGVGKSTVAQVMMADCLAASGVDPDPRGTAIIKESDKFDSSLKGDTVGIFFDDMGNTKKEFLDKAPTERLIDINNNMITYANKADLHEKGKVEIRPRVFVITSNAPLADHGNNGSIKPFSIVRRADIHIEVFAKDEYALPDKRLDSKKALRDFSGESLVNDVWKLDLYVPRERKYGGNNSHLISADGKTEKLTVGIHTALKRITAMCVQHFENQKKLISKGEGLVASRKYCETCLRAHDICSCALDQELAEFQIDPISEQKKVKHIRRCETCWQSPCVCDVDIDVDESLDDLKKMGLIAEEDEEQVSREETFEFVTSQFEAMGTRTNNFLSALPNWLFMNSLVRSCFLAIHAREFVAFERTIRWATLMSLTTIWCATMSSACFNVAIVAIGELFIHILFYFAMLAKWRDDKFEQLAQRRDLTMDIFASIRRSKMFQFFSFCVLAKVLYNFTNLFRAAVAVHQSALAPTNVEEIDKRDKEENPWAQAIAAELHVNDRAATMTHEQVVAKISQNLLHGTFVENDFQQSCDVLALGGNVFLMPYHLFRNRKDMKALLTRKDPSLLNSTFRAIVSTSHIIPIQGKDLCVVYIASGGVFADIKHLFPDTITASGSATFLYKEKSGELRQSSIRLTYTRNSESGGPGFFYDLPYDTFTGLCMGTAVAKYARHCIACVHLRGVPNTPKGKGLIVTRGEIENAIHTANHTWKGAFPSTVNGNFPVKRYEKQVLTSQDIHPNSPVNYLPMGSNVEYVGQGGSRVSHTKSKVRVTPISNVVAEVTGIEREHGAPKFHRTRMWQASLAHSANPSAGIEGSLLVKAYEDYVSHLIDKFSQPDFKDFVRRELTPLTEMETLCGKDGKRFIDAMKKGTSKGFPLSGPKRDMIELLDPLDFPGFQCPAKADSMIVSEMEKMEETLAMGERCYSIFKACVKDEPTKLTKDKVRVFQAADWATQMLVRKYFLPLARILSLFPLDSECAVGVNAQGPEWDQLAKHMCKFGADRILAGDYSKYDLRMPAQLINGAFAALIEIAQRCGRYSKRDLTIMRGISTEIAYSCVAYNGDLIIHKGSNPSGQNLTVYINCIVNSLQLRCAYFHLWPTTSKPLPFREVVSIMTYGDDVKGSVRNGYDWFNHISYAQFLRERDMVFTMPDKESTPTMYMRDCDADFLKRHNIFNEDTGMIHGALDETSIFKSLHTVLESKVVSLEDQSISNIDGALREWWQHGRDVYELRRKQMKEVAFRCGLTDSCHMLNESYEDRLVHFRHRYLESDEEEPIDESTFVTTVGDEWDVEEDFEPQCGMAPSLEEIEMYNYHYPSNVNHCRGDAMDPFFSWEHILGNLLVRLYFYLLIWILLLSDKFQFKWGFPTKGWIYFLIFNNLRWEAVLVWFIQLIVFTYWPKWFFDFFGFLLERLCG